MNLDKRNKKSINCLVVVIDIEQVIFDFVRLKFGNSLNSRKELGAGIMTRPECMKAFMRQIGTDCYILPGSIHGLLAYPCGKDMGAEDLQQMVAEVNQAAVPPEKFLSDSVYFCHMDTRKLELCCNI